MKILAVCHLLQMAWRKGFVEFRIPFVSSFTAKKEEEI